MKKELILENIDCANCATKIEYEIRKMDGITNAFIVLAMKTLVIEINNLYNPDDIVNEVKNKIKNLEPNIEVIEKINKISKNNNRLENIKLYKLITLIISIVLFIVGCVLIGLKFSQYIYETIFLICYVIIGFPVLKKAFNNILRGDFFDEYFLMSIATIGAIAIGSYEESTAVMLLFQLGEYFQDLSVNYSRNSIAKLMDIRPDFANLESNNDIETVPAKDVKIGDIILIKPGEKVPLDGIVVEGESFLDTSALTGESVPREISVNDKILSGFINKNGLLKVKVTQTFEHSTASKILEIIQNASSKKAPTENFITKFAKYYTPAIIFLAFFIAIFPPVIMNEPFIRWVYRALVFLVISCPCALVLSIPLSFFCGIGASSRSGVLVKGSNYLEAIQNIECIAFDKTGTLTKGVFDVSKIIAQPNYTEKDVLEAAAMGEFYSTHPISVSILKAYSSKIDASRISNFENISGCGTKSFIDGQELLVGSAGLLEQEKVIFEKYNDAGTIVYVAFNKKHIGTILIADAIKKDSAESISKLKELGVKRICLLTGDNKSIAENIAKKIGIGEVYSNLLPQDKVSVLEKLIATKTSKGKLAFVGDGLNDAPVLARADIGIAMGALGSDAAIEAADVVLMTDELKTLINAIKISRKTKKIVWQNIIFALGIKVFVLFFGIIGIATMWSAVFADVGVTLLTVFNAMRIIVHIGENK